MTELTDAQKSALLWLRLRNGGGVFDKNGVLLAAGERAPVMRGTWKALLTAGMVWKPSRNRLAVTMQGELVNLSGVMESGPALDWDDDDDDDDGTDEKT